MLRYRSLMHELMTYAVQMEWVSIVIFCRGETNLDGLSSGKDEGVFSNIEVPCFSSTINDFLESWNVR